MGQPCLPEAPARGFNFAAGPAVMPVQVLAQAKREFLDWEGSGFSILETPFTGDAFKALLRQTSDDLISA